LANTHILKSISAQIRKVFNGEEVSWPDKDGTFEKELFQVLLSHQLIPLIHNKDYQTGCCSDWPDSLRSKIADIARQEIAIELIKQKDVNFVLNLMDRNNIHPLLIKGTPLSYTLYPAAGLRPRGDTDLLICKKDSNKVAKLMKEAGYQCLFEISADFLSSQTTFYKYDSKNIYHAYDIHWQISNIKCPFSRQLNYETLIKTTQVIPELGSNAKTLNNLDAMLLACFHRAAHFPYDGERLIWLYDIHLLAENISENDLQELFLKAQKLKISTICSDAIFTAQDWFNTTLPERTIAQFKSPNNSEISASFLKQGRSSGIKNRAIMAFRELPSWSERFQYVIEKLFPPMEYMIWRYNTKKKYLLYYFYFYRILYGIYVLIKG